MKKALRLNILAASLLLSCGALAGCGGETAYTPDTNFEKSEIVVWATAAEEAVINKVVEKYNSTQTEEGKKFKISFTAVAEGDAGTTLAKDPTVANSPALFLCADDHIASLTGINCVAEIKGDRKTNVINNNTEVAVSGATLDGKLYGYPVTSDNGYFLWYDNSIADIESKKGSLEDLLALAKSLGKSVLMDVANGWYANSFIMSPDACGVDSLTWSKNAEGKNVYTSTWDNETGVKVSEYIGGLLKPYYDDGTLVTGSNPEIIAGFKDKKLIAAVSGTWMENDIKNTAGIGANTAATTLPKYHIDGKAYQMASFIGSKVYCINKTQSAANQKTAAALAELLTTKEAQLIRFEERATLPCNKEAIQDARYTEHTTIGGAALTAQAAYGCVQAKTAESRYWDVGKEIGQAYIDGKLGKQADDTPHTWTTFLRTQMDKLRNPGA